MSRPRRIISQPPAGIAPDSDAPFWKGARAEKLVAERAAQHLAEKEAKRAARRGTRSTRAKGERREKTPHQQLRRLKRALLKRKTLAARQRVQLQINALKRELGE